MTTIVWIVVAGGSVCSLPTSQLEQMGRDRACQIAKPNIGILSEEFLDDVRNMKQRNLAVELLERLLKDDIKARFSANVVQNQKFSELLQASLVRYRNRSIETAQVIEELIEMARSFNAAFKRGEELGLSPRSWRSMTPWRPTKPL